MGEGREKHEPAIENLFFKTTKTNATEIELQYQCKGVFRAILTLTELILVINISGRGKPSQ